MILCSFALRVEFRHGMSQLTFVLSKHMSMYTPNRKYALSYMLCYQQTICTTSSYNYELYTGWGVFQKLKRVNLHEDQMFLSIQFRIYRLQAFNCTIFTITIVAAL